MLQLAYIIARVLLFAKFLLGNFCLEIAEAEVVRKRDIKKNPAFQTVFSEKWDKALVTKKDQPLFEKLYLWYRCLLPADHPQTATTQERLTFLEDSTQWPKFHKIVRITEELLLKKKDFKQKDKLVWFAKYPPQTFSGYETYLEGLLTFKQKDKIKNTIKTLWLSSLELTTQEIGKIVKKFTSYVHPYHQLRLERLLVQGEIKGSEALLPYLDFATKKIARIRVDLLKGKEYALEEARRLLNQSYHPGLALNLIKAYRKQQGNDDLPTEIILQLININNTQQEEHEKLYSEAWWLERNILARRLIERKLYKEAFSVIENHQLEKGKNYIHAEWMQGWLLLRFLQKIPQALKIFENLYEQVKMPISRARMAYWAYEAAKAYKNTDKQNHWFKEATDYPYTYYGQLALDKLNQIEKVTAYNRTLSIPKKFRKKFDSLDFVTVIRILSRLKKQHMMNSFFDVLARHATTSEEHYLLMELANQEGDNFLIVEVSKKGKSKILPSYAFPINYNIPNIASHHKVNFKALVNAVIRQESRFKRTVRSPAGAKGLMQLMPDTAKQIAKKYNITLKSLDDPKTNINLGAIYLNELLDFFEGEWILAVAAYNAGKNVVVGWLEKFGDPRKKEILYRDFIELIPYAETRNYVQRVRENYYAYTYLKKGKFG